MKINLFEPSISKNEEQIVLNVLRSKFWASGSGQRHVKIFEDKFRKYTNSKACLAVNSGTAALNIALSLIDLKGKEVILPSLSFVSTANCILKNGGKPIFVDIEPKTLCINPDIIEDSITSKTVCVLPVHFGGTSANILKILKICKKYNLKLIEDAAHATGTVYKNKKIGSHGFAVCFSFHPVKNLSMPTGGMISINAKNYKNNPGTSPCLHTDRGAGGHCHHRHFGCPAAAGIGQGQGQRAGNILPKQHQAIDARRQNV